MKRTLLIIVVIATICISGIYAGTYVSNKNQKSSSIICNCLASENSLLDECNSENLLSIASNSDQAYDYVYVEETCSRCYGTGRCEICKGQGQWKNPYTGDWHRCSACSGSGRCSTCQGRGVVTVRRLVKR